VCGLSQPSAHGENDRDARRASGGRVELGIGAGWKEDEWRAYGYGFPSLRVRLSALQDDLEVLSRMLAPGRATYTGTYAHVEGAINLPRGLQQPRVPLMVGGNGPNVTWRLAAAYADELNLDWMEPDEVASALPVIAAHCEEIGRDPQTLRVSVHLRWDRAGAPGGRRIDDLGKLQMLGLSRVQIFDRATAVDDEALGACVGNGNQRNWLPLTPRNGADVARLSPLVPRNRL